MIEEKDTLPRRATRLLSRIVLALVCCTALPDAPRAQAAQQIRPLLSTIVRGQDRDFGTAVAPAQSLDTAQPTAARAQAAVDRIVREIDAVAKAFTAAAPADRITATRRTVAGFSAQTAQDGAERAFEGSGPSLSLMRQLLFVPSAAGSVGRVMGIISSFEHSPKPDDTYYEYSDPRSLKASAVKEIAGSAASWLGGAQPAMAPGEVHALKKCRHIILLGWYCNTALYEVRMLNGAAILATVLHRLPKGADNPTFTDGRAENIVDGYTALYYVAAADNLILVYDLGIQSKAGAPSQTSRLNEGHKEEYRQLVRRLETDLKTKLPF